MNYNYGPEGIIKQISANEFWNHFASYHPKRVDSCQILGERLKDYKGREIDHYSKKEKTNILGAIVFIYSDFCFVVEHNHWEESQRFWKVAVCHHDYVEVDSQRAKELGITHWGNCYHVYECSICHRAYGLDSSG